MFMWKSLCSVRVVMGANHWCSQLTKETPNKMGFFLSCTNKPHDMNRCCSYHTNTCSAEKNHRSCPLCVRFFNSSSANAVADLAHTCTMLAATKTKKARNSSMNKAKSPNLALKDP